MRRLRAKGRAKAAKTLYSVRNACCGAMHNARRIGAIEARMIVMTMHATQLASIPASFGAMPNSCDRSNVTAASAAGTPMSVTKRDHHSGFR